MPSYKALFKTFKMKPTFLPLITLLLLAFASCDMADNDSPDDIEDTYAATMIQPGEAAPSFTLATPDGRSISLGDYSGQYLVLDFWASWCPDCQQAMPKLGAIYGQYNDKAAFLGISFDKDRAALLTAIATYAIRYPQVSEYKEEWKQTDIYTLYNIRWIPSFYVVSPEGIVALATTNLDKLADFLARL